MSVNQSRPGHAWKLLVGTLFTWCRECGKTYGSGRFSMELPASRRRWRCGRPVKAPEERELMPH